MSGFFQTMFNTDTEGNFPKLFLQTRRAITGCAWNQIKALRGGMREGEISKTKNTFTNTDQENAAKKCIMYP